MTPQQKELTQIAKDFLNMETLETQNSDELDFHDLSTEQIKQALLAAYRAGKEKAQTAKK